MAEPGMAEPGMAEPGQAEPGHTGTGPGHSPSRAQLNREGIQAIQDTAVLGGGTAKSGTASSQTSPSNSGLTFCLDQEDPGLCLPQNCLPPPLDTSCGPPLFGGHLRTGRVGTLAAAPGIKAIKCPRLWGLVLGDAEAGKTALSIPQASWHPSEPATSVQGGERPLTHPTTL